MADRKPQNNGFSSQTQMPILGLDPPGKPKRNKYAFACAILASMTSMLIGYDIGVMSGAGPFIKDDLKISDVQLEILMGILNVYCLLGSAAAGRTSDWVGRRYTIVVASAIFFVGAILMGFATNYAFLMVGRFVAGIGAGYAIMIAPVYTAELSPADCRGFLVSFPEVFGNTGILLGYVSNYAFSKLPLHLGWRFMLGVGVIPSVFLALGAQIMKRFQEVTACLEQALGGISYEKLDISDEVKEQVDLVLAQFRRAKGRVDSPDVELHENLLSLYNNDASEGPAVIRRVAEKLQLMEISDLTQESIALHEMVSASGGDPGEGMEKMSMLLKKIKDFVQTENPDLDSPVGEKSVPSSCSEQPSTDGNSKSLVIPDDFRCPISLELMRDPVIVSTGQTFERSCIEKWLGAGHGACPKTQQTLTSNALTPNYVLRSLIAQWCEANGIKPPKQPSSRNKISSAFSPAERIKIETLLHKLTSSNPEDQRSAAGEIRLLAKRNADNRVAIAEAGAIPLLVSLLSTPDSRTQEHAVTALLNLSICEDNKGSIVSSGAVPGIVLVLKKGSMEARENAAATLFSLSVIDENKIMIGSTGAIPPLVTLLSEGTQRGKKDAATALFNLCIFQGNKGRAVRAGVVPTLMQLLTEPQGGMVDEALAILAILSSHPDGKVAIGAAEAVPVLVEVIGSGSPRNKENAAAVLVHLCSGDQQYLIEAQELGVMGPLVDLAQNGTDRGKRKAAQLLDRINRFVEQQKLAQAQAQTQNQPLQSPSPENAVDS